MVLHRGRACHACPVSCPVVQSECYPNAECKAQFRAVRVPDAASDGKPLFLSDFFAVGSAQFAALQKPFCFPVIGSVGKPLEISECLALTAAQLFAFADAFRDA